MAERPPTKEFYQQEQTTVRARTIRALKEVAVKHGYDMETGGCLTDWLDKQLTEKQHHWRRAYRILRDEVRRLRGIVNDVNFAALAAYLQEAPLDDLRAMGKRMVEADKPNNETEG